MGRKKKMKKIKRRKRTKTKREKVVNKKLVGQNTLKAGDEKIQWNLDLK